MAKSKKNEGVEMRAKPGKTIHRGIVPGEPGDANKNIPPKAPVTQIIQPKSVFVASDEDEAVRLIEAGAATRVSDEKKVKSAQELTDESAEAAAAAAAAETAEAAAAAAAAAGGKDADKDVDKDAPKLPGAKT